MPYRPKKACRHPGCARLVSDEYCGKHLRMHPEATRSASKRGYNSRWRSASKAFLKEHPLCVECMRHGKYTQGNVVDYRRIEADIKKIASEFVVKEIAYDRYNATQIILNLMNEGLTMVPFGQGFKDMSPPTKEIFTVVLKNKIVHNMNPVLRWNFDNVCVETDAAENIKPSKKHST